MDGQAGKRAKMKQLKAVAIRADASIEMGTGHVMRCLTLADAMRSRGARCQFISRNHPGNLIELIRQRGYEVTALPPEPNLNLFANVLKVPLPAHAHWLGCGWEQDAEQTLGAVRVIEPDLLVVDHYAIDVHWENVLRPHVDRLMVIDDLADRRHECDYLLDQNLGRTSENYASLVPARCVVCTGPLYALLRPEFASVRDYCIGRRHYSRLKNLFISMGGFDNSNATTKVLGALTECSLPSDCQITVVLGANSPWLQQVHDVAVSMKWPTHVKVGVENMAQLMADSDLAIGAAGITSWERCCVGLPTLLVVLAENQWPGAEALKRCSAAILIGDFNDITDRLSLAIEAALQGDTLAELHKAASQITDGRGVEKIIELLNVNNA